MKPNISPLTIFADPLTKFQLKGSTKVTQTGADSSAELLIDAVIDGKSVQLTGIETINGVVNNREVKWDFTIEVDVAAGPHKLEQKPIYNFDPGAAGDTVKVDSLYQITASVVPVPEPSTFVLLSVGLAGLAGVRKDRKSNPFWEYG